MGSAWGDRRSPLARKTPLQRFTRIKPVSAKRKAQHGDWEQTKAVVWQRDVCCQGPTAGLAGPCRGVLDVHHIRPQSRYPELRCEPSNCLLLCRGCHQTAHDEPRLARALGLVA